MPTPIILISVGTDDVALDSCLAALERSTPSQVQVWLADNAQAGPRVYNVIERWLERTRMNAEYTRRERAVTDAAHVGGAVNICCQSSDVIVVSSRARVLPGWYEAIQSCMRGDAAVATVTPWSNAGETASWPRIGEVNPPPADLERMERACASVAPLYSELPAAVDHVVAIRARAWQQVGGLDTTSYTFWYAALIDFSLRCLGLGWRNVLCDNAFALRTGETGMHAQDLDVIAGRWPNWHAHLAGFLMKDVLRVNRERLQDSYNNSALTNNQHELF